MSMRTWILGGVVAAGLGGVFVTPTMARDFDGRQDRYRIEPDRPQVCDDPPRAYETVRDDGRDRDDRFRHDLERHDNDRDHHEFVGHDRR